MKSNIKTHQKIVADSTFYLLFYADLSDCDSLHKIIMAFDFYVGNKIKDELKNHISKDDVFSKRILDVSQDVNFIQILKGFYQFLQREFPTYSNWIKDGEFEAIGISYHLNRMGRLRFLIIDDNDARRFVEKELNTLHQFLIRTPAFLCVSCKNGHFDKAFVVKILNNIKVSIEAGKSPLRLEINGWKKYIKPLIDSLPEENG